MADLLVAFCQQAQHLKLGAKAEIFVRASIRRRTSRSRELMATSGSRRLFQLCTKANAPTVGRIGAERGGVNCQKKRM
jgi:hypothetical protein